MITEAEPDFSSIAADIVIDILSRLPLKSLGRLTCVSKQWQSYAKMVPPRQKVLALSHLQDQSFSVHSIDGEGSVERICRPWNESSTATIQICGSCNGLLLMRIGEYLFLWNPLNRYFKKFLPYFRLRDRLYRVISGLCYDSSTDEYKAVMALSHPTLRSEGKFVVVGSSKTKTWKEVWFPYDVCTVNSGPVLNEHLYWFASESSIAFSPHNIVAFNPRTNDFSKVPMPEPKGRDGDIILGLGVLDGFLCMVRCENPSSHIHNCLEVLAMKECGVKESWTTMFIISNLTCVRSYDELIVFYEKW